MRLVASQPSFELIYAAGEGSAGSRLVDRFPGVPVKLAELVIEKWDPVPLPKLDVLFASLPTGASAGFCQPSRRRIFMSEADGYDLSLRGGRPRCVARNASRRRPSGSGESGRCRDIVGSAVWTARSSSTSAAMVC